RKWFEVAGTQGTLVCDDFVVPWSEEKSRYWVHDAAGKGSEHNIPACVQEMRMIDQFCRAIRSGTLNDRWPADSIAATRICDVLGESARRGQVLEMRNP